MKTLGFLSLLLSSNVYAATVTNIRIYYSDNNCAGNVASMVNVVQNFQNTQCAGNADTASPFPCETKNTLAGSLSSESTGCLAVDASVPWFPNSTISSSRNVPGVSYWYWHRYFGVGSEQCVLPATGGTVEVFAVAADNKCYANEAGYYYKGTCDQTSGTFYECNDALCNNCFKVNTTSTTCQNGQKGFCVTASQISNLGIASSSINGGTLPGQTDSTGNGAAGTGAKSSAVGMDTKMMIFIYVLFQVAANLM